MNASKTSTPDNIGNQSSSAVGSGNLISQPKLAIGAVDDPLEYEADAMADKIMRMPEPKFIQRKCEQCDEEEKIQRKPLASFIQRKESASGVIASDTISSQINSSRGSGSSMDRPTQSFVESRFGTDFSNVKIHTGDYAVKMSEELNAQAFTVGSEIYFNSGKYNPSSESGKHLLAHELTHTLQQEHLIQAKVIQRQERVPCTVMHPENCPTYEGWTSLFTSLPTFAARDTSVSGVNTTGFTVIGGAPANRDAAATDPAAPINPIAPQAADHFIDHPTQQWLNNNLPEELRLVAYQLPADCADIAIVLRHVWLFYHNRSETYHVGGNEWVVGIVAGESNRTRTTRIHGLIRDHVYSGSVGGMLNAYTTGGGNPIRSFAQLAPLLHPGDILVWEHHGNGLANGRTGGHTQTIMNIRRDSTGTITSIDALQGNQPIFHDNAVEIQTEQLAIPRTPTAEGTLRDSPGRRVEIGQLQEVELGDILIGTGASATPVWSWNDGDHTTLVAAGPAASAERFSGGRRVPRLGALSNWQPMISAASISTLQDIFEVGAQAARSVIEGTPLTTALTLSDADANTFGQAVGNRLASLITNTGFGIQSHFTLMTELLRVNAAFRNSGNPARRDDINRFFTNVATGYISSCSTIFQTTFTNAIQLIYYQITRAQAVTDAAAISMGKTAGNRVWAFAQAAEDFAGISHFDIMILLENTIQTVRGSGSTVQAEIDRVFTLIYDSFRMAARGAAPGSIDFTRAATTTSTDTVIRTLVTGFEPFNLLNSTAAPRHGEWNPSGAAVLALDGTTVDAGTNLKAAVEGVVFPVSFSDFRAGMVERVVRPLVQANVVDSVITVSEDPGLTGIGPVRLEQFAVGVHSDNGLESIPQDGTLGLGAAIIETVAPVANIAQQITTGSGISRPLVGTDVQFSFASADMAGHALYALGLQGADTTAGNAIVSISNVNALHTIINTMVRQSNGRDITFTAGSQTFTATLIQGPGGNFLSNEISFRVLRLLAARGSADTATPVSFHVHTQGGGELVPDGATPSHDPDDHEQSRQEADGIRSRLIKTLQGIIAATARFVYKRSHL